MTMNVDRMITLVIGLVVLFQVGAELIPEAQTAGDSLNASGVPLGGLFTGTGVVFVILMAAILTAVVRGARSGK